MVYFFVVVLCGDPTSPSKVLSCIWHHFDCGWTFKDRWGICDVYLVPLGLWMDIKGPLECMCSVSTVVPLPWMETQGPLGRCYGHLNGLYLSGRVVPGV